MRNIALCDFDSLQLKNLENCEAFCQVVRDIYAYGQGKIIKVSGRGVEVISNLTENLYPVAEEDDIPKAVDITFCCEKELLYLILFNGDIVSLRVTDTAEVEENIVGSVDDGIKAAQWSPSEEVVALVTGSDNVIVMTQDFDPISEVHLHGGGFGEKQFITVGWGKKETQFRGSEGKFNAKDKKTEEPNLASDSNNTVQISWRGDTEYFAVSCINPDTSRRYFRVFSKNGTLQYTSEDVNGLEHNLSWSPSGSLIASTQILPNKYVVCFFEKNGLRHGEFKLPFSSEEIKVDFLFWNNDSKILAILITKTSNDTMFNGTKYIQLYTVSNYHWYCKYTINFDTLSVPLVIKWDSTKANTLNVVLKREGKIYFNKYSWLWTVNKSRGGSLTDKSLVAVIDGTSLKVTSFSTGIIPPPMCTHQIQLPAAINFVSFAPDVDGLTSSNDLFVQLSDNTLVLFKCVESESKKINFEHMGEVKNLCGDLEIGFNIQWVEPNIFMLCTVKYEEDKLKSFLTILDVKNFEGPSVTFERSAIPLQSTVALLRSSKCNVLIHTNDGELYSFHRNENKLLNVFSNYKGLLDMEIIDKEDEGFSFCALDRLNKFYVNNSVALDNALSFHIHGNFIVVTTMKHELLCFNVGGEGTNFNLSDVSTRRVERGSRVVTSVQKDSKVILQMPRGNLECVQPRALSLFVLGKYLDSSNYHGAFDLMRKQRINLNLIHDHDPVLFAKNVCRFLEQMKDLQWISLFLADLTDEDVTQTMYSVIYKNKTNDGRVENKISVVCELIERALTESENPEKYVLPLLMCYIKRGTTEYLEKALSKLKELKEKEQNGLKPTVTFDEAFRYVLYLIDVDELYKVALGMYDFDLVLIVAGKSQKDPKEYLEFLNELRQLEPNYQKFRIDKYLKRYKKALGNLVKCEGDDVFNECINFIKTHKLYRHALRLLTENTDRYKNICMCYGDELMGSNCYEEAGFMYFNAGNYKNSMDAYRKSGNWQEVLLCAAELKLDEDELKELYLDLAMELYELKKYRESAVVYADYLNDVEECVRTLSKGKFFAEAYRITHLHHRVELIRQIIVPEVIEQGNQMESYIANCSETYAKQKTRLQIVRKQKAEVSEDRNEFDDLYSDTNTIITQSNATSRTTNRTYRSAKNKRKQERKLLSLKEGSPYEDLALVTSLHNIATNCVALKTEVRELNKHLLKIGQYDQAERLQKALEELLHAIETSKSEIWTPDLFNSRQVYGPESTSNEKSAMFMRSENVTPVLLNPKYAVAPETQNHVKWQLEVFSS